MELSTLELENESVELLPAREALARFSWTNIAGIDATNTAVALNIGSLLGGAHAHADQSITLVQLNA